MSDLSKLINDYKKIDNKHKVDTIDEATMKVVTSYAESDPDLTIGYELVKLPSKGINMYGGIGYDEFKVEYLTSKDEDILTTPSLIENGTVLDVLLREKIKENISIDELYSGDKNVLTLFLRTSSYGFNYEVEVIDPRNGIPFRSTIDLSKLKFKKVSEKPDENGIYNVELPQRKKLINFKLLTSGEERGIFNKAEAIREAYNSEVSNYNSLKLKSHVVSVDGNTDRGYIDRFMDALPLLDSLALRKKINEVTPDLDMTYEFTTKDGYKFKSGFSVDVDFFFPSI